MRRTWPITVALACGAALGLAPVAGADSLVYVKDGTPYISAVDGSDAHVVTDDDRGQWSWASATDGGTVFLAQDSGDVAAYPPGAAGQPIQAGVFAPLGLADFVVAPDGSSLAYMALATSPIDHRFVHNSYWVNLADGFSGQELARYWPAYSDPSALWLGGDTIEEVSPPAHTERSAPTPADVSEPLEAVRDGDGRIAVYRDGGSVVNFDPTPCPAGETCETESSRLVFVEYDSTGTNVLGDCISNTPFTFEKLAINNAGTLAAMAEPDGIHEFRIGNFDATCSGFADLGLVVAGGWSPDFTPSDDRAFPYVAPPPGGGSGGGSGGGTSTTTQTTTTHAATDAIAKVALARRAVKAGRPLIVTVTLKAKRTLTVTILRRVPASGHGRHRKKAHYATVGRLKIKGRVGANRVRVRKLAGHRLKPGRYRVRIVAGGASHTVTFRVTR